MEAKNSWVEKLEIRWGVKGWKQIAIIFLVFSLTGSSSVFIGKNILSFIGITPDMSAWIRIPLRILAVFFIYQILLLWIGFLFGQFKFFYAFEQKMWSRMGGLFTKKNTETH